jgi:hypothetical protein
LATDTAEPESAGASGESEPVRASGESEPARKPRVRRRVTTPPPAGTDPTPAPEAPRHPSNENDARMHADKPPHY